MEQHGYYCGDIELQAAARVLDKHIVVYDAGRGVEYSFLPRTNESMVVKDTIFMLYLSQSKHYKLGIPKNKRIRRVRRKTYFEGEVV